MKKILILLISVAIFSCKSKTELLTGKQWNIYMSSNYLDDKDELRVHKENESGGFFFSKDGSVEISEYDKRTVTGTWRWGQGKDGKDIQITWMGTREDVFNVVKLEKNELLLSRVNIENKKIMLLSLKAGKKN
jgi:hypothetical protein